MPDTIARHQLAGAVALVTGASSGIGAATAVRLSEAGCRPLLVGRDAERLSTIAERTAGVPIIADLASPEAATQVAMRALDLAGRVDILVHNAGIGWAGQMASMPEARLDELVAVNILAPLRLTRLLLSPMVTQGRGHLVFVSSIAGRVGVRGEAVYAATKAAIDIFADSLRLELAGTGVAVSVVTPGAVRTPFFQRRGVPYGRSWPRPVSADRVAAALVAAVTDGHDDVFVPRWLTVPARLRGSMPRLYRRLARRFG